MGIKVETEHNDIYEELEKYLKDKNIETPCSKEEFYENCESTSQRTT